MANGSWVTVESVVLDYVDESEKSIHNYYKLWNIAFRGMEDMGLDFFYEIKTVKIPIAANGTALLPENINWIKVGIFDSMGAFYPLNYNPKLTSYGSLRDNRKAINGSIGGIDGSLDSVYSITSPYFYNYGDGYLCGNGWYGGNSFNVDEKNGIILFDNWSNISEVAVEVMCAPKQGEEYYIPLVFRQPLIEWIGWRDIKHLPRSRRGDLGEKRDRKHDYYNARRLAASRYNPFSIEQAAVS